MCLDLSHPVECAVGCHVTTLNPELHGWDVRTSTSTQDAKDPTASVAAHKPRGQDDQDSLLRPGTEGWLMTGISRGTPQSVSRPSMTFHIDPGLATTDSAGGRLRGAYLLRPPGAGVAHAILIQAPGQQPAQRIQGKVP